MKVKAKQSLKAIADIRHNAAKAAWATRRKNKWVHPANRVVARKKKPPVRAKAEPAAATL